MNDCFLIRGQSPTTQGSRTVKTLYAVAMLLLTPLFSLAQTPVSCDVAQCTMYGQGGGFYAPGLYFVVTDQNDPQLGTKVKIYGTISKNGSLPVYWWSTAITPYDTIDNDGEWYSGQTTLTAAYQTCWNTGGYVTALMTNADVWTLDGTITVYDACDNLAYTNTFTYQFSFP